MGECLGRIETEYIIKALRELKISLRVHGGGEFRDSILVDYAPLEWIEIGGGGVSWVHLSCGEKIRIYFTYYESTMTFESEVIEVGSSIRISYPQAIYKDLKRKYERLPPPDGLAGKFVLTGVKRELEFPKSEEYFHTSDQAVPDDLDIGNLPVLINNFYTMADHVASNRSVKMFRENPPSSIEENIVARTGKPLFIPNVRDGLNEKDESGANRIITEASLFPEGRKGGIVPGITIEALRLHFFRRASEGVISCLYYPILYEQYVVGYLMLEVAGVIKKLWSIEILEYVGLFARLIACSLEANGYFNVDSRATNCYDIDIRNVSASGLLFSHKSASLWTALALYLDFGLNFDLGDKSMEVKSRVMRKDRAHPDYLYGVQFLNFPPYDFHYFFGRLYGRPFSDADRQLWEGGSSPPELNLG